LPSDWEKTGRFGGQAVGGILGARGGAKVWSRLSDRYTMSRFRSGYGVIKENIQVEAVGKVNGKSYYDTNQSARNPARANPEEKLAIYDIVAKKEAKNLAKGKDPLPNKTMEDAHAEVGVIHQAMKDGNTKGLDMTIQVRGTKEVCGHCQSDLKAMAKAAELRSLRVEDTVAKKVYLWSEGAKKWEIFPLGH
jgi:hypothetical protein